MLEDHGFRVTVVRDPNQAALEQAFREFINRYGQDVQNRLLFYFAGHGHTLRNTYGGEMGYIVPTDAPNPNRDERGFRSRAMDMQQMEVYARRIQAKHALFVFDACFSGSIFALSRAVPEHISHKTAQPVRQFITSGSADEQVPDESIFRQQFVRALEGKGDTNGDGYVTGVELGEFLYEKVVNYSREAQHPQYGKIRDPNLDNGDFVFVLPQPDKIAAPASRKSFSLDDLNQQADKAEQIRQQWTTKLDEMETAFAETKNYEARNVSAGLKITAWQRFLDVFAEDNPYHGRDEDIRGEAQSRLRSLQNDNHPSKTVSRTPTRNPKNAKKYEQSGQNLQEQAFAEDDVGQHTTLLKEMIAAYERATELDPARSTDIEVHLRLAYFNEFQRGIQAFNRGGQAQGEEKETELNAAASYFGNAAMMFPDSSAAYINQALAYFGSGQTKKAIQPFEMAVEKGDTSEDTFVYLGDLYKTYDQPEKGVALMEQARQIYPENESIQAHLMNFYVTSGRESEALQVYKEAVANEPNNKLYRYNYGSLMLEMEDYEGAIEQLKETIRIDPEYANAQYNLGAAYINWAVVVNEEVTTMDDELRRKRSGMSSREIRSMEAQMESLADQRRNLFSQAIQPLEKARRLTIAEGGDAASLQPICQALFQSYVQTGQTQKAEAVAVCAGYDLK